MEAGAHPKHSGAEGCGSGSCGKRPRWRPTNFVVCAVGTRKGPQNKEPGANSSSCRVEAGAHPKHSGAEECGSGKLRQEATVETHQFCSLRSHGPEPMWFRKSAASRTSLCVNHEQPESSSAVHRREANVMDLDLPSDAPYSKFQTIWGWMCDPHLAVCHKVKIVPLCVRVFLREAFLDLSSDAPNSQNECWSQSTFSWVQREKSGSGHTECLLSRGLGWPAKLDASLTWRAGVRGFHRGAHRVQRAYARRGSRARDPTCVSARSPTFSLPRVSGAYLRVLCFLQKYTAIHSINVLL